MNSKYKSLFFIIFLSFGGLIQARNPVDFQLKSATDESHFTLSEAKGKFVALHFLLKTECPFCIRRTQDYFQKASKLPDVIQVFIKPDTEEEIRAWAENLPKDELSKFPIYRDPEAKLAGQFKIPDGYQFHNQIVHYPALVLFGPDGREVFRYVGKNNTDRFPFEKLEEKIRELTKK